MLIDAGMSSQRVVCVVCNLKIIIKKCRATVIVFLKHGYIARVTLNLL